MDELTLKLFELNMNIYVVHVYILRHTRAVNSTVSDRTWPKFKLVQYYIYIFFLYKFKRDRINRALERVGTVFIDDLG